MSQVFSENSTLQQPLEIHIESDREDKQLSLYHAGISLTLLQRLINSIVEDDDITDSYFAKLNREERIKACQLGVTDVSKGSINITAMLSNVPNILWPVAVGALQAFGSLITGRFFRPVKAINNGENPFTPNEKSRKYLEQLSLNGKRGGIIHSFRFGSLYCFIDSTNTKAPRKAKKRDFWQKNNLHRCRCWKYNASIIP